MEFYNRDPFKGTIGFLEVGCVEGLYEGYDEALV